MPRHKKEVELKSWLSKNFGCVVLVEFSIDTLNKETLVICNHYSMAEIVAKNKYPSATKVTLIRVYNNPYCL
jgi:hypothetical protein